MKPSDFATKYPYDSLLQKSEAETVCMNVMQILKRTGDIFRDFEWDEYKEQRLLDGNFSEREKTFFDMVIGYCKSADTAKLFSPSWS